MRTSCEDRHNGFERNGGSEEDEEEDDAANGGDGSTCAGDGGISVWVVLMSAIFRALEASTEKEEYRRGRE